jgi:DNA invertase Pin-like site-specific DNA recombinase
MMTDGDFVPRALAGVSEKIFRRHRERLAIVYIRQSTVQQVERHQESTRLQYALVDRAFHLGWARETIVVVDDDLGRSGARSRGGLVFSDWWRKSASAMSGLVLGVEMSRLARSCRDWHQLLKICALFDTLIADTDGVYDPAQFNDRLLLGLKGTMSEAELHILKARMLEGRRAKARRGELGKPVPMGYVRRLSDEVVLDPDEQAQGTIRRCSSCSNASEPSARCCAIWSSMTSGCRCERPAALAKGSWNGVAPTGLRCTICLAIRSIICRRLRLWRASERSAAAEAGPPRHRAASAACRGSRGISARSGPRLHHPRAVRAQSGAASRQPGGPCGPSPGGQCAAVGLAGLRPVRIAHDGGLQQCRPCGALRMHRAELKLWRAILSVVEGRTGRRTSNVIDPTSTAAGGAGGQSGGCR